MMSLDESKVTVEEVDKALAEIESKYSHSPPIVTKSQGSKKDSSFKENLIVLSKEFDSLGLPVLDLKQPIVKLFKEVIKSTRSLVHIHRNAVSHMKDVNIECNTKETKKRELWAKIEEQKLMLKKSGEKCLDLYNMIDKLNNEKSDFTRKESEWKKELEKIKRYHTSKENELYHTIRKLKNENDRLQQLCGKDISAHGSNADVALKLLTKYKVNEEIYKATIHKLQDNNKQLLDEVLNLKEDYLLINTNGNQNTL